MVVRCDFEVQLVHADIKIPFKEHEKDDKIYVEAESDADISKDQALKHVIPKFDITGNDYQKCMGNAEVWLYEGHYEGPVAFVEFSLNFDADVARPGVGGARVNKAYSKKFLLSTKGEKARFGNHLLVLLD